MPAFCVPTIIIRRPKRLLILNYRKPQYRRQLKMRLNGLNNTAICRKLLYFLYFRYKLKSMNPEVRKKEAILKYVSIFLILNGVHFYISFTTDRLPVSGNTITVEYFFISFSFFSD